jgi:hypothetical protein
MKILVFRVVTMNCNNLQVWTRIGQCLQKDSRITLEFSDSKLLKKRRFSHEWNDNRFWKIGVAVDNIAPIPVFLSPKVAGIGLKKQPSKKSPWPILKPRRW